jgi:hypothetical protein
MVILKANPIGVSIQITQNHCNTKLTAIFFQKVVMSVSKSTLSINWMSSKHETTRHLGNTEQSIQNGIIFV